MRVLFCLLINVLCFIGYTQTNEYYSSGELKKQCLLDSTGSGVCSVYYPNGHLNVTWTLVQKMSEGKRMSYFYKGKIQSIENYTQGERQGEAIYYFKNGNIHRKGTYLDDFYNGKWYSYHKNGKKKQVGAYLDGEPNGDWLFYDIKGRRIFFMKYDNGKVVDMIKYHPRKQVVIN